MKKRFSFLIGSILTGLASQSFAYNVYSPVFYGDTTVSFSTVRIFVSNVPTGNCDGQDLFIDLNNSNGDALYQSYLAAKVGDISISQIIYSWDNGAEKCFIDQIKY